MKFLVRFFISWFFFRSFNIIFLFIKKKKTDVLIYYPQHFNTNSTHPFILHQIVQTLERQNRSYAIVEEPSLMHEIRNKNAIPADIFWGIVIIARKFFRGHNYHLIDQQIGRFFSLLVNHQFSNIITVTQSFQSILGSMFPNAQLFDYQHGLISPKYAGYLDGNQISQSLVSNKCKVLLYGAEFQKKLAQHKQGAYFINNSSVVGSPYVSYQAPKEKFNDSILYSLQFTGSHSKSTNHYFLEKTIDFFKQIDASNLNITMYVKEHPRFENCIDVSDLYTFKFVKKAPEHLSTCFKSCTLHLTEYSSVVFDALVHGVPTILSMFSNQLNILLDEYDFPQPSNQHLVDRLIQMTDESYFQNMSQQQINWSKELYSPFMSEQFLGILNQK